MQVTIAVTTNNGEAFAWANIKFHTLVAMVKMFAQMLQHEAIKQYGK